MSNQRDGQGNSEKLPPCPPSILRNLSTKQKHRCRPVLRWAYHPNLETVVSYWNLQHVKGDCYLEAGQNIATCKLTFTILRGYIFSKFWKNLSIMDSRDLKNTKKKGINLHWIQVELSFLVVLSCSTRFSLQRSSPIFDVSSMMNLCHCYEKNKLQGMIVPYHLYGSTRAVMQSDWLPLHSPTKWMIRPGSR